MSDEGQVSDAENLRSAKPDTPLAPDQSVHGAPDAESGETDEGPAGPNARTGRRDAAEDRPSGDGKR
jgi:hypothetical protein